MYLTMPPPTAKTNKHFGNSTDGPPKLNEPSTSGAPTSSFTPELEQKFQVELYWCIQQLQTALKSGKLNSRQVLVQDHTKALNTLMSNTAPIIKKRQVMRLSFGDYRAKMAAEEKKCSANPMNIKFKPAVPSKKSVFVKKSTCASLGGTKFQFNFEPPNDNEPSKCVENVKMEVTENSSQAQNENFAFLTSDNSFRFGFDVQQ